MKKIFVLFACMIFSCNTAPKPVEEETSPEPIFWGFAVDGFPVTSAQLEKISSETKLPIHMVLFYLHWPEYGAEIKNPVSSLNAIWDQGAIPCVSWEPFYFQKNKKITIPFSDIVNGQYDHYIKAMATFLKDWKHPVIIRFAHEMNLKTYHWGTSKENYGQKSPEIYKKMYRYLVDKFREFDATNVLWAFSPNAESMPSPHHDGTAGWNNASNYYPGNDYIDILGMDGYNWGRYVPSNVRSFEKIFIPLYKELRRIAPDKPIFIFETASRGTQKEKAEWIKNALEISNQWGLKGIVWFQVNKEHQWKLDFDENTASLIRQSTSSSQMWLYQLLSETRQNNSE